MPGRQVHDAKMPHFDEPTGILRSGNHHLVGKNGAKIGNALAVEAEGKLTTTWGRLKQ